MLQSFDERNRDLLININGELIHRDQAGISPFDSAVQGGDAVWEGLRLYEGKIFRLERHLDRLFDSAKALAFQEVPSREEVKLQLQRTLEANGMDDGCHVRLTLSRGRKITSGMDPRLNTEGPTLIVLAEWKAPVYDTQGLKLITSSVRRFAPDMMDPKIHHANLIQSIMAKLEANYADADDALMLDNQGFLAETNATHVFLVQDGMVRTPFTKACPEGVTRDTVLKICAQHAIPHEVADLSRTECFAADEMFCTGTMGELASVVELDGRPIGDGKPGPMCARLSKLFRAVVAETGEQIL
ncbi:MAG: aminotransferase class IV [Planctomycetota bacterium]